jgi:long-subunit acyl-CoA synthetase (AMP-forming)
MGDCEERDYCKRGERGTSSEDLILGRLLRQAVRPSLPKRHLDADISRFLMRNNLPGSGILDAVVFNKVKAATGGRMRFCMNGAAVR